MQKKFRLESGSPTRFTKTRPNIPILYGENKEEDVLLILYDNNNTSGDTDIDIDFGNDMNG